MACHVLHCFLGHPYYWFLLYFCFGFKYCSQNRFVLAFFFFVTVCNRLERLERSKYTYGRSWFLITVEHKRYLWLIWKKNFLCSQMLSSKVRSIYNNFLSFSANCWIYSWNNLWIEIGQNTPRVMMIWMWSYYISIPCGGKMGLVANLCYKGDIMCRIVYLFWRKEHWLCRILICDQVGCK